MNMGSSDTLFLGRRGANRPGTLPKNARRSRQRSIQMEGLEARTLLATIPAPTATGAPQNLSNLDNVGTEYANSPVVAINPYNPSEVVSVWVVDIPIIGESFVEGEFTTDGGTVWNTLPGNAANPDGISTSFAATDPGVAFDSQGNAYVSDLQSGTITLSKFTFTGTGSSAAITPSFIDEPLYTAGSAVLNPVLAVDQGTYPNSGPSTSPPSGITRDPFANNVYVAWTSNDLPDPLVIYGPDNVFNPNRIEVIVSSDGGQTFSGVTTVNNGAASTVTLGGLTFTNPDDGNDVDTGTGSIQDNAHPQIVINPNDAGQITVGWSNVFTGELDSNSVQAGTSTPATQLTNSIGNIFGPLVPDPEGDWAQPVPSSSIYSAGPSGVDEDPVAVTTGDLNGDKLNDIVLTDDNSTQGGIGVLLNQGAGAFPASATIYNAGNSPVFTTLQALFPGQTSTTILDALVADSSSSGGVTDLPNNGAGVFGAPRTYATGPGTDSIGIGNFDGTGNVIVAANGAANTITLVNPATGAIIETLTTGLDHPTDLDIADFNNDGVPDIGVYNSGNNKFEFFLGDSTGPGNFNFKAVTPQISSGVAGLPTNVTSVTYGSVSGGVGPDIILTTNTPGKDSLWILSNVTTAGLFTVSLDAAPVADSAFNGTPVGAAVGALSLGTGANDIAVAYSATTTHESMVAVYRNLANDLLFQGIDYGFQRTVNPNPIVKPPDPNTPVYDFDAGQTNPTAITVANVSGGKWDDIIVANNDGGGTVSVLEPLTPPTPSSNPTVNDFPVSVNVANPSAVTGLIVSVALTVPALADVKLTLIAPNGDSITLLKAGAIAGTELGTFTPADVVTPLVFDDNASQNILDGAGTAILGSFRPQSDYITTETLDQFVEQVAQNSPTKFNGTWTLAVTESTAATLGFLQEFSLQFTTRMTASTAQGTISTFEFSEQLPGTTSPQVPPVQTFVMPPALGDNYQPTITTALGFSIASPLGIGPGLVMAQDETLGPDSPFQGRIYAAFVGYYDVVEPSVTGVANPIEDTVIFEVHSDDGGQSWSTPVAVDPVESQSDGYSGSNSNPLPDDEVTGREQFLPAIAVDQATGTLVISWRDAQNDPSDARVTTYLTTSIDGGQTFGPASYANPSQTAVDAITGKTVVIGPEADNESVGAPTTTIASTSDPDLNMGWGTQMGLAVYSGQVFPMWSGNANQGVYDPLTNTVLGFATDIFYRPMAIAAGPRITTSTMGQIPLAEAASGAVTFSVTFDRAIISTSFGSSDVEVFYHDTKNTDGFIPLKVTGVSTTDDVNFTITFDPNLEPNNSLTNITNFTGTYSYLIAPDNGSGKAISAPIWSYVDGTLRMGDPMDQNADGTPDQNAETTPFTGTSPGDVYAVPTPAPDVPINVRRLSEHSRAAFQ